MTRDEIKVKFDALGRDVVGPERCSELGELIMSLDTHDSLQPLMQAMTAQGALAGAH